MKIHLLRFRPKKRFWKDNSSKTAIFIVTVLGLNLWLPYLNLLRFPDGSLWIDVGDINGCVSLVAAQSTTYPHSQALVATLKEEGWVCQTYCELIPYKISEITIKELGLTLEIVTVF